jgi:hypothetical protein
MSVSGIHSTFASGQVNSLSTSNSLNFARAQQFAQGAGLSNLDAASDGATFEQSGSSSASSTSQGLSAAQKAYEFLQQNDVSAAANPVNPNQFSGGPVRRGVSTGPIQEHEPMPPVYGSRTNLPNPIQHDPMPPVFGSPTAAPNPTRFHDPLLPGPGTTANLPIPTQFHDPLDPPVLGTTTSVIA